MIELTKEELEEARRNIERDSYMYDTYFYRVIMSRILGQEFYYWGA